MKVCPGGTSEFDDASVMGLNARVLGAGRRAFRDVWLEGGEEMKNGERNRIATLRKGETDSGRNLSQARDSSPSAEPRGGIPIPPAVDTSKQPSIPGSLC